MAVTMGRLLPASSEEDRRDYSSLLGFGTPTVRVDPHTHVAVRSVETNLRQVVEIIRSKNTLSPSSSD